MGLVILEALPPQLDSKRLRCRVRTSGVRSMEKRFTALVFDPQLVHLYLPDTPLSSQPVSLKLPNVPIPKCSECVVPRTRVPVLAVQDLGFGEVRER